MYLLGFYNPRKDQWVDHFELSDHLISAKTDIGEATIKILGFNAEERLTERLVLLEAGHSPHANALILINQ